MKKTSITKKINIKAIFIFVILITGISPVVLGQAEESSRFLSLTVDPGKSKIELYWKDDKNEIIRNFQNLKSYVEKKGKRLTFAMNGGMFMEDYAPLGLFVQKQKTIKKLNTASGSTNFYMKPNGVFYITLDHKAHICTTPAYVNDGRVNFATQSGPMLLIDGKINTEFTKGSKNINIRNGVGILPNNKVIFAISTDFVNFYDFAEYFKNMGCTNALYLDGAVSQMYLPEKNWEQMTGDFGVMIGITE
jgi:uncharacterized protein YigE (DUF2233 family)